MSALLGTALHIVVGARLCGLNALLELLLHQLQVGAVELVVERLNAHEFFLFGWFEHVSVEFFEDIGVAQESIQQFLAIALRKPFEGHQHILLEVLDAELLLLEVAVEDLLLHFLDALRENFLVLGGGTHEVAAAEKRVNWGWRPRSSLTLLGVVRTVGCCLSCAPSASKPS